MSTNWSEYQQNVFNFVANVKGSAVISAVAGSGKTTTIVEAAKRIPQNKSVLFLAFNRSIAEELTQRLASYHNITCLTSHSHGYKTIARGLGSKLNVDKNKYFTYVMNNVDALSSIISCDTEDLIKIRFIHNVVNLLSKCRINLIKSDDKEAIENIAFHHSIELIADEIEVVSTILENAYNLKLGEKVDFDDMLTLACTKFKRYVNKYDFVFIDECQDLSKAQRELMSLSLSAKGRFIAVGDRRQAINGFAGAGCDSFDLLAKLANNNELPLSVNYRCGKDIIKLAQDIVPQITAFEGARDGKVINVNNLQDLKPNDMVLCRKAAPLVRLCLKMFASGISAKVKGTEIGEGLIRLIEKLTPKNINSLYNKLDDELTKTKDACVKRGIKNVDNCARVTSFIDKIECIKAFAESAKGIADLKRKIEFAFSDEQMRNAVCLSTIHKSKGLESDRVFILCPDKLPLTWKDQQAWELEQENNLKYVAITRAKKELYFVNLSEKELANYDFKTKTFIP